MSARPGRALVWFRSDLRTLDNIALAEACANHDEVRGVFFDCHKQWQAHDIAPIRLHFQRRAVNHLGDRLAELGIRLDVIDADHFDDVAKRLSEVCSEHDITHVYANKQYLLNEMRRDARAADAIEPELKLFDDAVLVPPEVILKGDGTPYKVFTPYSKQWMQRLKDQTPNCRKRPKPKGEPVPFQHRAAEKEWKDSTAWAADEDGVLEQLRTFCRERADDYKAQRDTPSVDGTSSLSAALSAGLVSPRQCFARLHAEHGRLIWDRSTGPGTWLVELCWREFYRQIAFHFPRVVKGGAFRPETDDLTWNEDEDQFEAWCEGKTGFPIVDAAMRQLKHTGWMHNRLRMITASFLVKDLHQDWRKGERWFMRNLIDGDFASNNGGWQWAASTGTDSQPYFRVFNPFSQSEKFDPEGKFIARMVPELKELDNKRIHQPPPMKNYPSPIVDHKQAREIAIAMFKAVK